MSVELKHWLQSINLDHYLSDFRKAGYTTLEQCEHLSDESLNEIGITLPGHRRRVLAHLPKKEDFKPVEDEHLYGNLPTPSSPPECSAPKPKPPHTYVNAPTTPSSDAVYSNVAFPQPAPVQETPCSPEAHGGSRSTLAGRDGSTVFDDSESFYDVLPPPTACKVLADDADGGEYVNIALSSSLEGAVGGVDLPPALPPKKNKVHRRSLDDAMVMSSVSTPPEGTPKRPVPKPRTTVRSGGGRTPSSDGAGADESPRNSALSHALFDVKKKPSPPMLKPIPKPRPRPSARGTKSQDSGSSNSSASGSPRLSPVPRVPSPNMPTELAPSPPIHAASPPTHAPVHTHAASPATSTPSLTHGPSPQTHSPSVPLHGPSPPKPPRQKLKASPSVPIPAVPVKQHEPAVDPLPPPPPPKMTPAKAEEAPPPPRDERPPAVEPMLSLETEVPPAEDAEPCDLAQVKIPLPKCPHHHGEQNHHQSNSAAADSNATFWRVDSPHTYENTKIQTEQKYQDPDEPEKLDDFIKSLMSTSAEPAQHSVPDLLEKPDPPTLVDNLLLPGLPEKRPETDVSETAGNQLNDKPILPDKASVGAKEQTPASNSGSNEVQEDLYQVIPYLSSVSDHFSEIQGWLHAVAFSACICEAQRQSWGWCVWISVSERKQFSCSPFQLGQKDHSTNCLTQSIRFNQTTTTLLNLFVGQNFSAKQNLIAQKSPSLFSKPSWLFVSNVLHRVSGVSTNSYKGVCSAETNLPGSFLWKQRIVGVHKHIETSMSIWSPTVFRCKHSARFSVDEEVMESSDEQGLHGKLGQCR